MKYALRQLRYWGRGIGMGLYVVVSDFIVLGHPPTFEEAWIPLMKGALAVLASWGLNATIKAHISSRPPAH